MRQITETLWIGNAFEASDFKAVMALQVGAIVDLAMDEPPIAPPREIVYCRIPLLDGTENPASRLLLAIDVACKLLASKTPTLICCSAGMSRSPAIAAAALACTSGQSFHDSLTIVSKAGACDISPGLVVELELAIANRTGEDGLQSEQ